MKSGRVHRKESPMVGTPSAKSGARVESTKGSAGSALKESSHTSTQSPKGAKAPPAMTPDHDREYDF